MTNRNYANNDSSNFDKLFNIYRDLQNEYGDSKYDAITSGGNRENPNICFIFMNPTARNIAASKSWTGIKAPWIGTKGIWSMLAKLGLFSKELANKIRDMKPGDWTTKFASQVYSEVASNNIYITNLAKCTQADARHLNNKVFQNYLRLTEQEIALLNPKLIVTFGNQVSSIFLKQQISVSKVRQKIFQNQILGTNFSTLPVFYPLGQGRRNMPKAIEDIAAVIDSNSS